MYISDNTFDVKNSPFFRNSLDGKHVILRLAQWCVGIDIFLCNISVRENARNMLPLCKDINFFVYMSS